VTLVSTAAVSRGTILNFFRARVHAPDSLPRAVDAVDLNSASDETSHDSKDAVPTRLTEAEGKDPSKAHSTGRPTRIEPNTTPLNP
jgi:hypothetical protein